MQILIFGDDNITLEWVNKQIAGSGQFSFAINTPILAELSMLFKSLHFEAVIYDITASNHQSKETITQLIDACGKVPLIILAETFALNQAEEALQKGASMYLIKEKAAQDLLAVCLAKLILKNKDIIK